MMPSVSLIVPVWQDAAALRRLLAALPADPRVEVIVAAAAGDAAIHAVTADHPHVIVVWTSRGRARQMNAGAARARGSWLLFLHADSSLPPEWLHVFERSTADVCGGWFRFALDDRAWQARLIERGVQWRVRTLRLPYGDQGLFVTRQAFAALGGYRDLPLMEDVDFVRRLVAHGPVVELPCAVTTSARRWRADGWLRRSVRNVVLVALYGAGVSPARLARWYARRT